MLPLSAFAQKFSLLNRLAAASLIYFKNIEIESKLVDLGVSCQPKSEKKIIKGAKNRANQIFKDYQPDFSAGIGEWF